MNNCEYLQLNIYCDEDICKITATDNCNLFRIERTTSSGYARIYVPSTESLYITAKSKNTELKITNVYSYIPCTTECLTSVFRFNTNSVQRFILRDANYLMPVNNATLFFTQN